MLRNLISPNLRYDKSDDSGSSGSTKMDWPEEVTEGFKNLLSRQGSGKDAAMKLYEENYELRKEKRQLESKINDSVTLSEEEAQQWVKYKELDSPESLTERLEKAGNDSAELTKLKMKQRNRDIAEAEGWNAKAFARITADDADYEIKESEDGKYAVIKKDDKETKLSDYVEREYPEMLPALKQNGTKESADSGKRYTKQSSTEGNDAGGGYLERFKERNRKRAGLNTNDKK